MTKVFMLDMSTFTKFIVHCSNCPLLLFHCKHCTNPAKQLHVLCSVYFVTLSVFVIFFCKLKFVILKQLASLKGWHMSFILLLFHAIVFSFMCFSGVFVLFIH